MIQFNAQLFNQFPPSPGKANLKSTVDVGIIIEMICSAHTEEDASEAQPGNCRAVSRLRHEVLVSTTG